ncbi:MAG: hypothetical protein WBH55_14445, partial [Bacteroidota bacterium]
MKARAKYPLLALSTPFLLCVFGDRATAQIPPNDECTGATVITELPFAVSQDTRLATPNPADPYLPCANGGGGKTVWFSYTPPKDEFVRLTTAGSTPVSYDIAMGLFAGTCDSLHLIECNDDVKYGEIRHAEIGPLRVREGKTYYIHIAEWNGGGQNGGVPTGGDLVFSALPVAGPQIAKGPKMGTISGGVSLSTDPYSPVSETPSTGITIPWSRWNRPADPRKPAPENLPAPAAPEGSNYIDERFIRKPGSLQTLPVILEEFQGIPDQGIFSPPDPDIAAGPDHLVAVVNKRFLVFDKEGVVLKSINAWDWFNGMVGDLYPNSLITDPQILFDHFENRWAMTWLYLRTSDAYIFLAVSDDENPLGNWYAWALPSHQMGDSLVGCFDDYPQLGMDRNAFYVTGRVFTLPSPSRLYSRVRIVPKEQLYANTAGQASWYDIWDFRDPIDTTDRPDIIQPAVVFGDPGEQFLLTDAPSLGGTYVVLYRIGGPAASPTMSAVPLPVTEYSSPRDAQQKGGGSSIDTDGRRFHAQAVYRDGSLWAVHSIASGPNNEYSAVRYLRIDVRTETVMEDVALGSEGFYYSWPGIMVDQNNNVVITYTRSGQTEYAGAYVAGRKQDDPPGLSQSVALKLGESNYVRPGEARNRWGDYMGLALDPSDPNAIWVHTEYAASPTNTWGNWIGLIKMDPLATSVVEEGSLKVPEQFALQQNYPNPFNP